MAARSKMPAVWMGWKTGDDSMGVSADDFGDAPGMDWWLDEDFLTNFDGLQVGLR